MAIYQIESGTAHGRGFSGGDPNGFLAKFYTWVTKSAGSGGPGWTMIDDQSALTTDPYIVVCDTASPSVNDYNTGPSGGAPKFIKIGLLTTEAGYVRVHGYMWWDSISHVGYGLWFGYRIATYDDADFAYDFRGGDECMIIQCRLGSNWHTVMVDDFVGDTNLLEPATSVGVLQSGVTAGSSVMLQLDTGEAANFTVGKHYYLFDFNGHSWVDYVTVTARDTGTDQITVDNVSQNYPGGAVISPYGHRYYSVGNGTATYSTGLNHSGKSKLPYVSGASGYVVHNQTGYIYGSVSATAAVEYLTKMAPDDDGNYTVQRPGIYEIYRENVNNNTDGMNRGYGVTKNIYLCSTSGMTPALDGKTITGQNWVYMQAANNLFSSITSSLATLFLDTESAS